MGSSEHVIAIDAGSTSMRCSLYDGTGSLVEDTGASFGYGFETTRDGGATFDADALRGLVFQAIDETLARAGAREISGVALSTFWHGVLGVDRRGAL
jgi:sugar (pentulose or hexulose) kinase